MEKEKYCGKDTSVSAEERDFLVRRDKFASETVATLERQMKDASSSFKIDSALKRLYMALTIR